MFRDRLVTIVIVLLWTSINNAKEENRAARKNCSNKAESDKSYWLQKAGSSLNEHLLREPIKSKAKNVILFIGDGMSIPTVTAARILKGQKEGKTGEEGSLSFDSFPYSGLSKPYCVDSQVADSACSGTALFTGVKNNKGTIGVSAAVQLGDCKGMRNTSNQLDSILGWAQAAKKSTGIVTTTTVTHATPAATYARVASRKWEDDSKVLKDKQDPAFCEDIASQLLNRSPGKNINVILGGGRRSFLPASAKDEGGQKGRRKDGKDLTKSWLKDKISRNVSSSYLTNRRDLLKLNTSQIDYLLGLFSNEHMPYAVAYEDVHPTLQEMTKVAIKILRRNSEGYFLMVEGGRIDHAHHMNRAKIALYETLELSKAVQQAVDMTSEHDTLIVVTADHAHTMSISGYPKRGSDITGIAGVSDKDKFPYTTLSYANGNSKSERGEIDQEDLANDFYKYPATVPLSKETHGGDDVGVFARGCWAHLFSGVMEENLIPLLMGYASCIGPHRTYCSDNAKVTMNKSN